MGGYFIKQNNSNLYFASGNPYEQWTTEISAATNYSTKEAAEHGIVVHELSNCAVVFVKA